MGGALTVLYSTLGISYETPILINRFGSDLFISWYKRNELLNGFAYYISRLSTISGGSTYSQTISATPWVGFARGVSDIGIMYAIRAGAGTLYRIDISGSGEGDVTILDDGFPIVETDFFLSSGLIVDTVTHSGVEVVWGVSAPYYDEFTQELRTAGKYLLFKYDTSILSKVELADFEGLSVWDALTLLAEVSNCNMGFDAYGNFFFIKRGTVNTSDDYSFSHGEYDSLVIDIDEEDGRDEIFNYAAITPSFVKFEQPSYEAFLVERVSDEETADTANEDEILLKQTDLKRKTIRMICIQEGNANCGDGQVGYPKFKYLIYDTLIHARLAEDIDASETDIILTSVFGGTDDDNGIQVNDYLVVTNPTDESEVVRRITGGAGGAGTGIDPDDNRITLSSAIGFALKTNDEVTIQKRFRRSSSDQTGNRWSDDGVTYVTTTTTGITHTVSSVTNLSIDTVIVIGSSVERRITTINEVTLQITVDSSCTMTNGDVIRAYFAPDNSSEYFEIGGTNTYIKIDSGTSRAAFKRGDSFTITCPGLKIEKDEMSKQVAYDTTSISRDGKHLYPTIENRFMTRKVAKIKAKEMVSEYKNAKQILTITLPFSPYLNLITETGNKLMRVGITSKAFFRVMKEHKVSGYIRSITHNMQNGFTTIEIRALTSY